MSAETAEHPTDAEAPQEATLPAERPMSGLDAALRGTRRQSPDTLSMWIEGESVVLNPPLAMAPEHITASQHYADEHAASVQGAVNALTALRDAVARVIEVRNASKTDPGLNEAQAILLVQASYDKLVPAATRKLDAARDHMETVVAEAAAQLAQPMRSGANNSQAAELRGVLRAMSQSERMAAINKAVVDGDEVLAGAALGSHPLLSGLGAEMQATFTQDWNARRYPAQVRRLELAKHVVARLHAAGTSLMLNMEGIVGARSDVVQKLTQAQQKARVVLGAVIPQG